MLGPNTFRLKLAVIKDINRIWFGFLSLKCLLKISSLLLDPPPTPHYYNSLSMYFLSFIHFAIFPIFHQTLSALPHLSLLPPSFPLIVFLGISLHLANKLYFSEFGPSCNSGKFQSKMQYFTVKMVN